MSAPAASALLPMLSAERGALAGFVTLLEQEQSLLMEGAQTEQLLTLSEQKSNDATSLNHMADARHALLQREIPRPDAEAIQNWLGAHCADGLPVWHDIVALAQRAKQLNQVNGELIQMKLRHNQQALTVLSNAVNKAGVYGRNGKPDFSPGSGRSLGSG